MALTKHKIDRLRKAIKQKNVGEQKWIFCTAYTNGDYEYEGKIYHSLQDLEAEPSLSDYDINIFHWASREPPQKVE